tara:strand:- start:6734 stop:6919 length:186 start_codon:yes stop_codon:yes gene_type:complete
MKTQELLNLQKYTNGSTILFNYTPKGVLYRVYVDEDLVAIRRCLCILAALVSILEYIKLRI